MAKKLSKEQILLMKDLRVNQGLTLKEIAEKLSIGLSTVQRHLSNIVPNTKKLSRLDDDVLNEIKRLYVEEKIGSTTIASKLGLNEKTVVKQLRNMGIEIRGCKRKYDTKKIISMYTEQKIPIHKIAREFNSSEETISKILKRNNVEIYGHKIPRFDHHIFDSIDTEEKAYWLGFLFADGYVATINPNKPNYAVSIGLAIKDIDHLRKFNKFVKFDGDNIRIKKTNISTLPSLTEGRIVSEICEWTISNKNLWEKLVSYGCVPKKTYILQFPENKFDKSLIRHFIRGFFDGDGSITYANKDHTLPEIQLYCKSRIFIEKLNEYINLGLNIHTTKQEMYGINTSSLKALKFLHYLYDNCTIYLNRKYKLFEDFCRLYEESDRLLETKIMEGCDANHEVNLEIKESESPQRVETEPEKSE